MSYTAQDQFILSRGAASRRRAALACALLAVGSTAAMATNGPTGAPNPATVTLEQATSGPGRGLARDFEINYLTFIINHHFAALRMTELNAGTQQTAPTPDISPNDNITPSPNFAPTQAKATLPELKSLARRANRTQREEILEAQRLLREFYGMEHQPRISPENQQRIDILERTPPGEAFNANFIEVFSRHHYTATTRSSACIVASDVKHIDLERYCQGIVAGQLRQIDIMRHLLCSEYQICDYQPLVGLKGRHAAKSP